MYAYGYYLLFIYHNQLHILEAYVSIVCLKQLCSRFIIARLHEKPLTIIHYL